MIPLGRSLFITSKVASDGDLSIEGHGHGHVSLPGSTLIIAEHSHVEAEVRCARVEMRGRVTGTIAATESIGLLPSAEVTGNLNVNHFAIADGAKLGCRIEMNHRTVDTIVAGCQPEWPRTEPGLLE